MSLHLNLQCQRADKNTDTRITSLAGSLEHLVFCDLSDQTVWPFAAVTPLYGHPADPSNGFLQFGVTFRISARNAAALPFHPACRSGLRRTGFYAALADRLEQVCHATGQDVQARDPASVQLRPRSRPCWSGLQKPRSAVACGTGSLR